MANLRWRLVGVGGENALGRFDERIRLTCAEASEVVVVDAPEHDAAQSFFERELGLGGCHFFVVVADPLVVAVGERSVPIRVRFAHRPALDADFLTNLSKRKSSSYSHRVMK